MRGIVRPADGVGRKVENISPDREEPVERVEPEEEDEENNKELLPSDLRVTDHQQNPIRWSTVARISIGQGLRQDDGHIGHGTQCPGLDTSRYVYNDKWNLPTPGHLVDLYESKSIMLLIIIFEINQS